MDDATERHRKCTKCGESKPIDDFGRCRRSKGGREPLCRKCKNAITAKWRAENREKSRQQQARYRAANRDQCSAADKRWRTANREKAKAVLYNSRVRHKGTVNALTAMRYARKRHATPRWLTGQHKAAMRSVYEAAALLTVFLKEPHHVDHIVPLTSPIVCGLHVPWNLQILTATENIKKGNRL